MSQSFSKIIPFTAALFLFSLSIQAQTWKILPGYSIKFAGRSAEGSFSGLSGNIRFDPATPANGSFDVRVEVNTINTGNSKKDKDAKGSSWFEASKYPTIHFVSKSVQTRTSGYVVNGTMTIHGVSQPVSIPFTFKVNGNQGKFAGQITIARKDYNINGPAMGFIVGSDIDVSLTVPVIKN